MRALSHVNNKTRFGAKLPKKFRGYFWDCDFSALSLERSRTFILKRLLQYGGRDAMVWILRHFTRTEVAGFLKSRHGAALDRRSFLFWKKVSTFRSLWK